MVFGLKDMTQRFVDAPLSRGKSPRGLCHAQKAKHTLALAFFWCLPNCQRSKEKNRRETRRSKASFVEATPSIGGESAQRQRGVRFFFLKSRRAWSGASLCY